MKKNKLETLCVHEGQLKDLENKGAISPLYMATAYAYDEVEVTRYPRYFNTPNQVGLAKKIAALEGAEQGIIFGSGMAAISTSLLSHLRSGDHIEAVAKMAKKKGIISIIDNTFASPINQNPISFGIDVVIHSATKYLGGHSDILAGAVVGSQKHIEVVFQMAKNLGGSLSDYTVWLLERSMKTLSIRVKAQNENAVELAKFLESSKSVDQVYYPGLKSHPDHELACLQMNGFGGMLSFELSRSHDLDLFQKNLHLIKPAVSLAGVESTITIPTKTSHALISSEERKAQGIKDNLIRFSVGIEHFDDLKEDINQALIKSKL